MDKFKLSKMSQQVAVSSKVRHFAVDHTSSTRLPCVPSSGPAEGTGGNPLLPGSQEAFMFGNHISFPLPQQRFGVGIIGSSSHRAD